MSERLVEYLVIAGPGKTNLRPEASSAGRSKVSSQTGLVTTVDAKPCIVQRFPVENRPGCILPVGIEHFCQPLGWFLTSHTSSPSYNNFILTSELGTHYYCTSLNFYQPSSKMAARQRQRECQQQQEMSSVRRGTSTESSFRRKAFKKKEDENHTHNNSAISISSIDISLDEENEAHYTMGLMIDIEELYEPMSLCLVSKFAVYDALQALLKSIYIYYVDNCFSSTNNQKSIESLIAELLVDLCFPWGDKPPLKRSFGPLREITLAPLSAIQTLPYTSDNTYRLLKIVGVHGLLQIFSLILGDGKILFISSSTTALTSAITGVMGIMYPMGIDHFSCVLIPNGFLEFIHCITPYLMGLHRSLLEELDEEPLDVTVIDLDNGEIKLGEIVQVPVIPSDFLLPIKTALTKIIDPLWEHRDSVFAPLIKPKSLYYLDKAVRAVFLNIFLYILGSYQNYITIIRFHPEPKFYFNKEEYISQFCVGEDSDSWKAFIISVTETIGFISFTKGNRVLPYRVCDFFDELVKEYCSQNHSFTHLFSQEVIHNLAERLMKILPPAVQGGGQYSYSEPMSGDGTAPRRFPKLDEEIFNTHYEDLELRWKGPASTSLLDAMGNVPLLNTAEDNQPAHLSITRLSSSLAREMDSFHKFLDALFSSRILEARKFFPAVTMSLRNRTTTDIFVPELVNKLLKNGPYMTPDQFEVLVRIINCAIVDEKIAMKILPLTSVFYQEIHPGVNQYLFTCIQSHSLWQNTDFWCHALYHAVQAELVRVYAEVRVPKRRAITLQSNKMEIPAIEEVAENEDNVDVPDAPEVDTRAYSFDVDNEYEIGEVTLRHRQRVRSVSPSRVRTTARSVALSKNARMRIRACTTIPGASEGVLPPDSKPVTSYEALYHLAKRLRVWPELDKEEKEQLSLQEENAIRNQIILFISRMINIRTPIEFNGGDKEKMQFTNQLTDFIDNFMTVVDAELNLSYKKQSSLMEQVESLIEVHLNSLERLKSVLKKSPTIKARFAPLPLINGESLIVDGVHTYLLRDGRDTGHWVPADGRVYLTSYRVVFLGSPWDPEVDPNILVTRSMPISAIYRMKEISHIPAALAEGYVTLHGLQLRSVTAELLRLGFDEDSSISDVKNLMIKLNELRYPTTVSVGIRDQSSFQVIPETSPGTIVDLSLSSSLIKEQLFKGKRRSTEDFESSGNFSKHTPTQIKLISDLSQSPYCQEFERLGLGSLNFNVSKNRGQWRPSTINVSFSVCSSYPSVWVVPEKVKDEHLTRIAPHFLSNRLPIVTWKHPRTKAILLRSASFVAPATPQRKSGIFHVHGGKHIPDKSSDTETQGIMSADVETFIASIVSACPKVMEDDNETKYWSGSFSRDVSMPPASLLFDLDDAPPQSGLASQITAAGQKNQQGLQTQTSTNSVGLETGEGGGRESYYRHSLYASTELMLDWESNAQLPQMYVRELSFENQPLTLSTSDFKQQNIDNDQPPSLMPLTSLAPVLKREDEEGSEGSYPLRTSSPIDYTDLGVEEESPVLRKSSVSSREFSEMFGRGTNKKQKRKSAHVNFASIPTNPRDWVVMDALQDEIKHWKTLGLYIIGEKDVLRNVPSELYPNCTLLPVEVPHRSDIGTSFAKLMRACAPSGSSPPLSNFTKYFSLIEESEWLNQLSNILQLSGAVADLMDAQGSSVLVCLEDGWDTTAQIVSLAQILLDPHYRTLEGFRALVEKDWLAHGHPFTQRGCHTSNHATGQVSPVFLQFLDCVHQIRRQFPLSFEFNDFYLRTIAYHVSSMRFHTFTLDSEKDRCACNWLPYRPRPPNAYGDSSTIELYASFWEYIEQLHDNSMMFYNFFYQPQDDPEMLRIHSYQANLDVWSFYSEDLVSRFPPYDVELISEGQLTYSDLHHNVFALDNTLTEIGLPLDPPPEVASEITHLLKQYTGLMNTLGRRVGLASWKELWNQLISEEETDEYPIDNTLKMPIRAETINPEMTLDRVVKLQSQTLHKTTSLAVLVKGKLSMELESKYHEPHHFVSFKIGSLQYECCYCHHIIRDNEAHKCKRCSCVCHTHCKRHMPSNCGTLSLSGDMIQVTAPLNELEEEKRPRLRTSTFSSKVKIRRKRAEATYELQGFLFKKGGVVKNWKERYFVLDLEKRHLAYYENEKRGAKLCGKITLDAIVKVEQCDPLNVPLNVLKPGQVGYFFKLTTNRRIFQLMTLRDSNRREWLNKIREAKSIPLSKD